MFVLMTVMVTFDFDAGLSSGHFNVKLCGVFWIQSLPLVRLCKQASQVSSCLYISTLKKMASSIL